MILSVTSLSAQKSPERGVIRQGNALYEKGSYPESEVFYRRALELAPTSPEGRFNLSDALYKQERYKEAVEINQQLLRDSLLNDRDAAAAHYNQGNAHLKQRQLEEAIEAYKRSLRLNPTDQEAKFNLAYAQKLLQKDQNKDDNQQNKDDQKKQNDQQKDQDQNNNQQNKDQQNQQDKNNPDKQDQNPQQKNGQGGMSQQQAEQMLDAMQNNDEQTKKKLDAQKAQGVPVSGKNW